MGQGAYVDVNGLHMYYEVDGDGPPLVLLHGGVLNIELNYADLIPHLVQRHRVIAVETQGHGRTGNIDRPITYPNMASDVVGLLDHLGIDRADVMGHSMGGGTTMELAVSHPDRVRKVVPCSITISLDGLTEELTDPERQATSVRMPTPQDFVDMKGTYAKLSPHPEQFDAFLTQMGAMDTDFAGWTDAQLAGIRAPFLHIVGDLDFTTVAHAAVMLDKIPGSQLAVLPGTTHMQVTRRTDLLVPMLRDFLGEG
jgi:pimeloyl-ACP methyl ester carboxylesterase